jgi:hypothetical protein
MVDFASPSFIIQAGLDNKTRECQRRYELRNISLYDVKLGPQFTS